MSQRLHTDVAKITQIHHVFIFYYINKLGIKEDAQFISK
jgi:hypothetical protein